MQSKRIMGFHRHQFLHPPAAQMWRCISCQACCGVRHMSDAARRARCDAPPRSHADPEEGVHIKVTVHAAEGGVLGHAARGQGARRRRRPLVIHMRLVHLHDPALRTSALHDDLCQCLFHPGVPSPVMHLAQRRTETRVDSAASQHDAAFFLHMAAGSRAPPHAPPAGTAARG